MTPIVKFQGIERLCQSIEDFDVALIDFDKEAQFELWLNVPGGPSICMLRNAANAWLMYLHSDGNQCFNTIGDPRLLDNISYQLSNGQVDDYPAAWNLPVDDCFKALAYFLSMMDFGRSRSLGRTPRRVLQPGPNSRVYETGYLRENSNHSHSAWVKLCDVDFSSMLGRRTMH